MDKKNQETYKSKSYSEMLNISPIEKVHKMLDQKFQNQPVLTMKFELTRGMRLVKDHVESAASLLGIGGGGFIFGMLSC